jgi:hypothetical protein
MGIAFIMMIDLDDCHDALYAHDGVHLVFFMKGSNGCWVIHSSNYK